LPIFAVVAVRSWSRAGTAAAYAAAIVAFAYALVSLYWAVGGHSLVSTVGGYVEHFAREGGAVPVLAALAAAAAKVAGGLLALALVRPWGRVIPRRWLLIISAGGSALLVTYGGLNVLAGALVLSGTIHPTGGADRTALRWHVAVWDLWFLVWGILLALATVGWWRRTSRSSLPLNPAAMNRSWNLAGSRLTTEGFSPRTGDGHERAAVPGHLGDRPALIMYHCVSSGFVRGGDHRAGHARPAGLARLRDVISSWLEETSFRTALTASATALVLIVAAVAFALLEPGHGTAGGPSTVPGAVRSDLAGTAATSGAAPASSPQPRSPQPRAITVPSVPPTTPDPAPPSPAASPPASVTNPFPPATRSLPGCRHGHGRHRHC
jgi:hypothetical protein